MTTRVPARNIKPVNSMWSSAFTQLADQKKNKKITSSVSSTAEHFQRKRSPRSGLGCMRSLCPSLFRLHRGCRVRISPPDRVAGGPHRCAAVSSAVINTGADSDSPESSQWRPRKEREPRSIRALIGREEPSVTAPPRPPPEPVLLYVFFCWR